MKEGGSYIPAYIPIQPGGYLRARTTQFIVKCGNKQPAMHRNQSVKYCHNYQENLITKNITESSTFVARRPATSH